MRYHGMTLRDWYYEIRHRFRQVYSFFIRGYHGVAPMDTWNLDRYVLSNLSRGMKTLAKNPKGYPFWIPEEYGLDTDEHGAALSDAKAVECWQDWLTTHAVWIDWYLDDEIGLREDMSDSEKTFTLNQYDKKYKIFKEVILPEIFKRLDSMWD